jgi:hypothetical protein
MISSGVEARLPRQIVVPSSLMIQMEVVSSDTDIVLLLVHGVFRDGVGDHRGYWLPEEVVAPNYFTL